MVWTGCDWTTKPSDPQTFFRGSTSTADISCTRKNQTWRTRGTWWCSAYVQLLGRRDLRDSQYHLQIYFERWVYETKSDTCLLPKRRTRDWHCKACWTSGGLGSSPWLAWSSAEEPACMGKSSRDPNRGADEVSSHRKRPRISGQADSRGFVPSCETENRKHQNTEKGEERRLYFARPCGKPCHLLSYYPYELHCWRTHITLLVDRMSVPVFRNDHIFFVLFNESEAEISCKLTQYEMFCSVRNCYIQWTQGLLPH